MKGLWLFLATFQVTSCRRFRVMLHAGSIYSHICDMLASSLRNILMLTVKQFQLDRTDVWLVLLLKALARISAIIVWSNRTTQETRVHWRVVSCVGVTVTEGSHDMVSVRLEVFQSLTQRFWSHVLHSVIQPQRWHHSSDITQEVWRLLLNGE